MGMGMEEWEAMVMGGIMAMDTTRVCRFEACMKAYSATPDLSSIKALKAIHSMSSSKPAG